MCLCVCVRACVYPGKGNVAFNATPNPFLLNKICLNQSASKALSEIKLGQMNRI